MAISNSINKNSDSSAAYCCAVRKPPESCAREPIDSVHLPM
ncbi:Uncharacterised protein [Vibrio cholerae]|nr:Uncharacterised protein [Vibrio cholerae]